MVRSTSAASDGQLALGSPAAVEHRQSSPAITRILALQWLNGSLSKDATKDNRSRGQGHPAQLAMCRAEELRKPVALFIPGVPLTRFFYEPFLAKLAADFEVVTPEIGRFEGRHGEFSANPEAMVDRLVERVVELAGGAERVAAWLGGRRPPTLVGHSMGTVFAVQLQNRLERRFGRGFESCFLVAPLFPPFGCEVRLPLWAASSVLALVLAAIVLAVLRGVHYMFRSSFESGLARRLVGEEVHLMPRFAERIACEHSFAVLWLNWIYVRWLWRAVGNVTSFKDAYDTWGSAKSSAPSDRRAFLDPRTVISYHPSAPLDPYFGSQARAEFLRHKVFPVYRQLDVNHGFTIETRQTNVVAKAIREDYLDALGRDETTTIICSMEPVSASPGIALRSGTIIRRSWELSPGEA